jgi:hypothetical protein
MSEVIMRKSFLGLCLALSTGAMVSPVRAQSLMARTWEFGVTAAAWFPGTMDGDVLDEALDPKKNTGLLLRASLDAYVVEKLAFGVYAAFAPISWENYSDGSTMFEVGVAIKPRFPIAGGEAAIKPGLSIGYRRMNSDYYYGDKINGMALNMGCEVQFDIHRSFVPYVEVGFLAQPTGSNDYDDWTFGPPIAYLGAGIAF